MTSEYWTDWARPQEPLRTGIEGRTKTGIRVCSWMNRRGWKGRMCWTF